MNPAPPTSAFDFLQWCVGSRTEWPSIGAIDGEIALRLASRHKVLPLVHRRLEPLRDQLPSGVWERLHDAFLRNAARNEAWIEVLRRLREAFASRGVPWMVFRGPVSAVTLYGDPAMRQFADLDLLIHPADISRAITILQAQGFQTQLRLGDAQLSAYISFRSDLLFLRMADNLCVDLHWQILPPAFAFAREEELLWKRAGAVDLRGVELRTLADTDLLLFMCIHAIRHSWEYLALVSDLAEFMRARAIDWDAVLRQAEERGKKRILLSAVLLAGETAGAPMPGEVEQKARSCPGVEQLVFDGKRFLREERAGAERKWRYPWRALERGSDRLRLLADLAFTPTGVEVEMLRLPRSLRPLYYPLRWGRLLGKHAAGAVTQRDRRSSST